MALVKSATRLQEVDNAERPPDLQPQANTPRQRPVGDRAPRAVGVLPAGGAAASDRGGDGGGGRGNTGLIVAAVVGAVIALGIAVCVVALMLLVVRRRRQPYASYEDAKTEARLRGQTECTSMYSYGGSSRAHRLEAAVYVPGGSRRDAGGSHRKAGDKGERSGYGRGRLDRGSSSSSSSEQPWTTPEGTAEAKSAWHARAHRSGRKHSSTPSRRERSGSRGRNGSGRSDGVGGGAPTHGLRSSPYGSARVASGTDTLNSYTVGTHTVGTMNASVSTVDVRDSKGDALALAHTLDEMAAERPPGVFAGEFVVLKERARGGQSIVQFARDSDAGLYQFAIKFFFERYVLGFARSMRLRWGQRLFCSETAKFRMQMGLTISKLVQL